jgi:drug/metabolite transporter (DMT)-like permease
MAEARPQPETDDNAARGILWMVLGTLFISAMHSSIRHVSAGLPPFEITFFRNLFALVVVIPWLFRYGLAPFKTRRLKLLGLRAVINVVAMLCFFYALSIAPLTEVTALAFMAPIFATVFAVFILGERVGGRGWIAIGVGFAGALLILRPGFANVGLGEVLTLIASVLWACVLLIIKTLSRTESSITITVYMSLLMAPLALIPALFVWQWPTLDQLGWLAFIGLLGGCGQLTMTQALKEAPTNVVMPFDFLRLIWIAAISWFAFAEVPDLFTWLGGITIFVAGAYIANRERLRGKSGGKPAPV